MLAKPEYSSPPNEVCCWPGVPSGRNLLAKAHKNADFVLGKSQNQGNIAVSDTKMPFLCLKYPKMGVSEGKSAQKVSVSAVTY